MISRLLVLASLACLGAGAAHAATFDDPAAYCRAVGTIDRVDARYTGPAVPDWIAQSLRRQAGAPADAPLAPFTRAVWRCDGGQVLACAYGANIPCDSKADVSRKPGPGARRFCKENPGAAIVPAYATGHATAYEWHCAGTNAVISRQVLKLDDRGFPAAFWHIVTPD